MENKIFNPLLVDSITFENILNNKIQKGLFDGIIKNAIVSYLPTLFENNKLDFVANLKNDYESKIKDNMTYQTNKYKNDIEKMIKDYNNSMRMKITHFKKELDENMLSQYQNININLLMLNSCTNNIKINTENEKIELNKITEKYMEIEKMFNNYDSILNKQVEDNKQYLNSISELKEKIEKTTNQLDNQVLINIIEMDKMKKDVLDNVEKSLKITEKNLFNKNKLNTKTYSEIYKETILDKDYISTCSEFKINYQNNKELKFDLVESEDYDYIQLYTKTIKIEEEINKIKSQYKDTISDFNFKLVEFEKKVALNSEINNMENSLEILHKEEKRKYEKNNNLDINKVYEKSSCSSVINIEMIEELETTLLSKIYDLELTLNRIRSQQVDTIVSVVDRKFHDFQKKYKF